MFRRFISFTFTILVVGAVSWQTANACGGTASFTNGPYDWVNSQFYYNVTGAPANVCGTLKTFRNGSQISSPSWICTDGSGNATMGPYTGSTDQTDENIYILWPNNCQTTGGTRHVSDATPPNIWITTYTSSTFSGSATDTQWGTGFDYFIFGWSSITATFKNLSTGKFADHTGYNNNSAVIWSGSVSNYFGFSTNWTVTPPPAGHHNASHQYRWCVKTNDMFYSDEDCVEFTGVP